MDIDHAALDKTLTALKERLVRARQPDGCWRGRLSGSALSTAVAVFALSLVDKSGHASLINKGIDWLIDNQNADGGWGDTILSLSNISTTMLCFSALSVAEQPEARQDSGGSAAHSRVAASRPKTLGMARNGMDDAVAKAESWLVGFAGSIEPGALAAAVDRQHGRDRTFSVPILTMCVLAGKLGESKQAWRRVKPLPFELAIFPHRLFSWLRLPVVSYALPALIAIGQVNYHHRRPANPFAKLVRFLLRKKTLKVLAGIQPENGGFRDLLE